LSNFWRDAYLIRVEPRLLGIIVLSASGPDYGDYLSIYCQDNATHFQTNCSSNLEDASFVKNDKLKAELAYSYMKFWFEYVNLKTHARTIIRQYECV
jgi:hypothetical protein